MSTTTEVVDAIRDVTARVRRVVDAGERSRDVDVDDVIELLLMLADRLEQPDANDPDRRPRVGYDNVEFEVDGRMIVATVIGEEDGDVFLVGNPLWDDVWHVPIAELRLTDRDLNHPPADW